MFSSVRGGPPFLMLFSSVTGGRPFQAFSQSPHSSQWLSTNKVSVRARVTVTVTVTFAVRIGVTVSPERKGLGQD